jgi:hypothetical protein
MAVAKPTSASAVRPSVAAVTVSGGGLPAACQPKQKSFAAVAASPRQAYQVAAHVRAERPKLGGGVPAGVSEPGRVPAGPCSCWSDP